MMESTASATRLLTKAIRHPLRAVRRLADTARLAALSAGDERELSLKFLSNNFDVDARSILEEHARSQMSAWLQRRRAQLGEFPGPYRLGSTPVFDCETVYLLVRAMKPDIVVETGVCYGESSAYILQALNENGRGVLYSIDLGNAVDEPASDFFVPKHLLERWRLIIGDCTQELPRLLARLGRIDLFHHDSLHTYEHMMWEYDTAFPHLNAGGVLSSHDVRTIVSMVRPFRPNPFSAFCDRHRLRSVIAGNVGIAMRPVAGESRSRHARPSR